MGPVVLADGALGVEDSYLEGHSRRICNREPARERIGIQLGTHICRQGLAALTRRYDAGLLRSVAIKTVGAVRQSEWQERDRDGCDVLLGAGTSPSLKNSGGVVQGHGSPHITRGAESRRPRATASTPPRG